MDRPPLLDHPGVDTYLARLLHARGQVDVEVLQRLLTRAREERAGPGETLARALVREGVLAQPQIEAALEHLASQETFGLSSDFDEDGRRGQVGDYRVLERLGAGGMGAVFRAQHVGTGAHYALKTLRGVTDPEVVLRFQREAEGHARVDSHPNVVAVHTFGRAPNGLYLIMELVEGGSLEDYLRTRELEPSEAVRLVQELCRGLEHIHAQGVLHRDLKPANVLMDGDVPKLTDFGLAKLVGEDSLTVSGSILGTPAFMAPEQIDTRLAPLGERTDVYGLGAVLYRCLTGRAPFEAPTAMLTLAKVLDGSPTPPSALNPDVWPALDRVCLRALSKAHGHRYASVAAFSEALEEALGQRHRAARTLPLLLGAGGLLLAGLAALALLPAGPSNPPEQGPAAKTPEQASHQAPQGRPARTHGTLPLWPLRPDLPSVAPLLEEAKRLIDRGQSKQGALKLEALLRCQLNGRVRPEVATELVPLLFAGGEVPADPERGEALLFESALQGHSTSLIVLGVSSLSESSLERAGKAVAGLARFPLRADDELAASLTRLYPRGGITENVFSFLKDRQPASDEESWARLLSTYRARFPDRAQVFLEGRPVQLPLAAGKIRPEGKGVRKQAEGRLETDPRGALRDLWAILARHPVPNNGLLRVIAEALCQNPAFAGRREEGLDLFFESALRRDRSSVRTLLMLHMPPDLRRACAQELRVLPFDQGTFDVVVTPDLNLCAALARIHTPARDENELDGADKTFADSLRAGLRRAKVTVPATRAEAYETVWRHYLARRTAQVSQRPPTLPLSGRRRLPLHENNVYHQGRRFLTEKEWASAIPYLERVLRDPVSGKVRPGPARRLAEALLGSAPDAEQVPRLRALLLESALHGDEGALALLAAGHLSPRSRRDVILAGKLSLGDDDALATAAVSLVGENTSHKQMALVIRRSLREQNRRTPPPAEAYRMIWSRYVKHYPRRAFRLGSRTLPSLPLTNGTTSEADSIRIHRQRLRYKERPGVGLDGLRGELFDERSRLRSELATEIAKRLLKTLGDDPQPGLEAVDLLFDAALRGNPRALYLLCLGYAPKRVKEAVLESTAFGAAPGDLPFPTEPNPSIAVAAGTVARELEEPHRARYAAAIVESLKTEVASLPPDRDAAYEALRDVYLRRAHR